ncbi:MAG: acetyl-CoA carboxylase, carboxyltransferase subunit beta [bacterium]
MIKSFQNRKKTVNDFKDNLRIIKYIKEDTYFNQDSNVPDDMVVLCKKCNNSILTELLINNKFVCPKCSHHHKIGAHIRLQLTFDSFDEHDKFLKEKSFAFDQYKNKIEQYREKTDLLDAVITGVATLNKSSVAVAVMDSYFMMGSMGQTVGEKITRLVEYATKHNLPLVIFCTSGGARMQEGIISLMQMAKVSQAIAIHKQKNLYVSVLTHPTTGGVSASFASLGDITIAEPNSLIGFAGRRVIERTINVQLPDEFQTSEFLLDKGFIDMIVERDKLRNTLDSILKLHNY